jgi:hypothetical protein
MSKFWNPTSDKASENEVYEKAFEKHFYDKKCKDIGTLKGIIIGFIYNFYNFV